MALISLSSSKNKFSIIHNLKKCKEDVSPINNSFMKNFAAKCLLFPGILVLTHNAYELLPNI
jgi:hypothetical protein